MQFNLIPRFHLFEIEDQPWLPHPFRTYLTDLMEIASRWFALRTPLLPLLRRLLDHAQADTIIDLCSGSSGPLRWLSPRLEEACGRPIRVILTDKYPHFDVFEAASQESGGRISYLKEPIEAEAVPSDLEGIRTLFNAFHHFRPEVGRRILADAVAKRRAIGIFEGFERTTFWLMLVLFSPLGVWALTPFIRPIQAGRLFWTYAFPVVPVMAFWDGLVSCLRTYSPKELTEMIKDLSSQEFIWEAGRIRVHGIPAHVTYLLGMPKSFEQKSSTAYNSKNFLSFQRQCR